MSDDNWKAWEGALIPLDYSDKTLRDVVGFGRSLEDKFPPPVGVLRNIVRQSNDSEELKKKQLPEPDMTDEERSTAQKHLAEIKKILDEAGEKMSMERKARYEMPNQVREKSEPIYWDQNQCPDPDCLTKHRAEDCPKRKGRR
jgi:hypothetical protein